MLKIAWNHIYKHELPEGHRFPMEKYELLPRQLLYEGTVTEANFFSPRQLRLNEILSVHNETYWHKLSHLQLTRKEERRSGFPLSKKLVDRELTINGGTIQCAEFALEFGVAMNIAGGTHHAYPDRAEGFCLLNDIAIAARYLLDNQLVQQVLVVDLDVHQGNGTAKIFEDEPRVFTFSMHGAKNYPHKKEQSDLDIGLADGTNDRVYLDILEKNLDILLTNVNPDFIFYQSGVDVLATDKLGRLGMSINGCKERDRLVIEAAKKAAVPLVASMGGGYSENTKDIIEAHANTYRVAQEVYF